jgi:hypothetical protein
VSATFASEKLVNEIMSLGVEDYANLWEVLSRVRACLPEGERSGARERAAAVLKELAAKGFVSFWWRAWPAGDAEPLAIDEAIELLSDDRAWVVKSDWPRDLVVTATEAGERAYLTTSGGQS